MFTVEEASTADINFGVMFSGGDFPISGTVKWNERELPRNGPDLRGQRRSLADQADWRR